MGYITAEIELVNGEDIIMARKHLIGKEEIKSINVTALVDTGALLLCINENIQEYLQIPVIGMRLGQMADGKIIECKLVDPVEIRFKNRVTRGSAMVLPGDSEVLLGAIPVEDMDVLIDPTRGKLILHPDRPDVQMTMFKGLRDVKKDRL